MRATSVLSFSLVFCLFRAAGEQAPDLKALYEGHQWFRLRESVQASPNPPLFYRAAVAVAFHDDAGAVRMLREVIRSAPRSWEAGEAKRLRHQLVVRGGRLNRVVGEPSPSRFRYSMKLENLHIPLSINGRRVEYLLDTGAGNSVVSETEARRLGLRLHKTKGNVFDGATGGQIPLRHWGMARQLRVGNTELRDVLFLVFPDDTHFFKGRPPGENGILGLPAIQALETVRWDAEGNFDIGFPSPASGSAKPNLAFDDGRLALEVGFQNQRLVFGFDTGAVGTNLWVGFRRQFADLVSATGKEEVRTGAGASGVIEYNAIMLPDLTLRISGFETLLRPAEITMKEELGSGYHGNFGLDLLHQARVVTIDFRAMRLTLEGRRH